MTKYSNQSKLKILTDKVMGRIEDLLDVLGIDNFEYDNKRFYGPCPVHGGDKYNAINL